jgi:hypothetical protein
VAADAALDQSVDRRPAGLARSRQVPKYDRRKRTRNREVREVHEGLYERDSGAYKARSDTREGDRSGRTTDAVSVSRGLGGRVDRIRPV